MDMKEGWEKRRFDEIMTPARVERCGDRTDLPILSITMRSGIVEQRDRFSKTIASVDRSNYKIVKDGQLVIAFPIDEGLVYTQDVAKEGIMSPAYNIWDVDYSLVNRNFLVSYFHSRFAFDYYKAKLRGSTQRRRSMDKEDLLSMPIPVPPISEQKRIVEELDLLNGIIAKEKTQLEELDKLAQSIFYDMFGDPVTNEKSWKRLTLDNVVEITSKLVNPNDEPFVNQYHIGPANIVSHTGEIVDCKLAKDENLISSKYAFKKGMILYSKIRPNLNKVAIAPLDGICSADMYPLHVKENANNVFVWKLLSSKEFLKYAINNSGRARMPKMNREALFSYELDLPPLSHQQEFADKISAIEAMKAKVSQSLKEAEQLFNSRMDYYFN